MPKNEIQILLSANDKATPSLKGLENQAKKMEKTFSSSALNINASLALIDRGARLVAQAFELVEKGAKFDQQREAFKRLARSAGVSSEAIVKGMQEMSGSTVSASEAMAGATKAMVLGLAPDKLPKLMEIARVSARAFGTDVGFMFDSLSLGIGRQSRMLLDNLGIIVDAEGAYKKYADANGLVASKLTDTQKKQAFLNATLEAGQEQIDKMGSSTQTQAEKIAELKAQWSDFTTNLALAVSKLIVVQGAIEGVTGVLEGLSIVLSNVDKVQQQLNKTFDSSSPALKNAQIALVDAQKARQDYQKLIDQGLGGEVVQQRLNTLIAEEKRLMEAIVVLRGGLQAQPLNDQPALPTPQEAKEFEEAQKLQEALEQKESTIAEFQEKIKGYSDVALAEELTRLEEEVNATAEAQKTKEQIIIDSKKRIIAEELKTEKLKDKTKAEALTSTKNFLAQMGEEHRAFAIALKAIQIGETIINGQEAIGKIQAQMGVLAPPFVALQIASTALQVGTIASQGFAEGTDSVPAMLTPGEIVVPRSFSDAVRSGDITIGGAGGSGGGDINIYISNPQIGDDVGGFAEELGFEIERVAKTARSF